MEGVLTGFLETAHLMKHAATESDGHAELLAEIGRVKERLAFASARFDQQSDPDLLEECIYEMQALTARFRYLTREARKAGVTQCSMVALQRL